MSRRARMLKQFRRAATSVEYLLLLAALALVLILGVTLLPELMRGSYQRAAQGMTKQRVPLTVKRVFRKEDLLRKERR